MEKRGAESTELNRESRTTEPSSAAHRMLRAVSSVVAGSEASAAEVDAAAKALVTELRRANEPPEQVLVQIKQILADAGLRPNQGASESPLVIERHVVLYRTVIESSIRHYFAPTDGAESGGA